MQASDAETGRGLLYEVPEDLKHEERVFWVFTFKQALVFAAFLLPAFAAFQALASFDYKLRIGVPAAFVFTGFVVASVKQVQDALVRKAKYTFAPKRSNWMQLETLERFVGVRAFESGFVKSTDGRLLSVLLVTPVDYSVLGEDQKLALVHGYRGFLNSLSFPVQVVMRTTKVNLREYFAKAKAKAAGKRDAAALVELEKFEEFVEEFVAARGVNDRLFYLVIPHEPGADEEKAVRELEQKTSVCVEKLAAVGLVARKLGEESLVGLYASFFGGFVEVEADYLSILTMLDFAGGEYEKLREVGGFLDARAKLLGGDDANAGAENAGESGGKTAGGNEGERDAGEKPVAAVLARAVQRRKPR